MTVALRLIDYQQRALACTRCHDEALLYAGAEGRAYPLFQRDPTGRAAILVVAEAPNLTDSFDEDKRRLTYDADTDPTGVFARELLLSVGLSHQDVVFTNAVLCLPARRAGKYPVSARQLALCSPWLAQLIEAAQPRVVVTFGARALHAVGVLERHGLRLKGSAGKLHRWHGRKLLPLYHPGRLGRISRSPEQQLQDIAVLREELPAGGERAGQ